MVNKIDKRLVSSLLIEDEVQACMTLGRLVEPCDEVIGTLLSQMSAPDVLEFFYGVITGEDSAAVDSKIKEAFESFFEKIDLSHTIRARNHYEMIALKALNIYKSLAFVDIQRDKSMLKKASAEVITPQSDLWPAKLNDLGILSPYCIYVRGNLHALQKAKKSIAIVGSRSATQYGIQTAYNTSSELAELGFCVISGGAYGIDAAAHRGAIQSDTIAFMAGGVDSFYPAGNMNIYSAMLANSGLMASEMPPGSSPRRFRFLQRNRLIAALADATIVVEASYRSGALSTANHAIKLLRPLGAIPGNINAIESVGCNNLIKTGRAQLIASAEDAACLATPISKQGELLDDKERANDSVPTSGSAPTKINVLDKVKELGDDCANVYDVFPLRSGLTIDQISARSKISGLSLLAILGKLELRGFVTQDKGKWITK
jgi:DNA processing protein